MHGHQHAVIADSGGCPNGDPLVALPNFAARVNSDAPLIPATVSPAANNELASVYRKQSNKLEKKLKSEPTFSQVLLGQCSYILSLTWLNVV